MEFIRKGKTLKQKAYVEGNDSFLGTITLETGERYNFISGQRFLFQVFPFLQWFMPIYCWKAADDVNHESDIKWPVKVLLAFAVILYLWSWQNNTITFYIPPIITITFSVILGIIFVKYKTHKYVVPQGVTLYKIRLYPGKSAIRVVLGLCLLTLAELAMGWLVIAKPSVLIGHCGLLMVTPMFFWLSNTATLNLRDCQVKFLGEINN